jgi:hypothetical protein
MIVLSEKNYVRAACTAPPVMRRQLPSRRRSTPREAALRNPVAFYSLDSTAWRSAREARLLGSCNVG